MLEQTAGYQSRIHTMHSMHSKIDVRNARKCVSEPWTRGVNWSAYVLRAIHMEFSIYWEHPAASHLTSFPVTSASRCTYAIL